MIWRVTMHSRTIVDPQYLHVLREVVVFMTPPVLGNIAHQDAREN